VGDRGTRGSGGIVPQQLIGERIAGRFVVERLIGTGELSTAFRAHDDRLHRRVTVKLFHARHADDRHVVESQLAAARSVARLSHEHIAMVIDRGEHEGLPLVVLEHVRGETLSERMERYAPLAVEEVAKYALQLARALAYAHGHGVVHGNVRPGNVLLTEERDVKLVDFGGGSYVARLVGDPFAAPELREVDADAPAEASDDIYALGALAFAALTEQAPVAGIDAGELQLLRPDVSPRLASTIARTLAVDPDDRHLSMRELAAELAAAQEPVGAPERSTMPRGFAAGEATQAFDVLELDDDTQDLPAGRARPTGRRVRRPRRERSPHEVRARILAWSMVLVPLLALVVFGVMIAGERAERSVARDGDRATGPVDVVEVQGAASFDPEPAGDGSEHPEEVANLIDGDPDTTWETEGYDTSTFNGAKPGVGVILQLAEEVDVQDVMISTALPGWKVEVRSADRAAATLDEWTRVSEIVPVEDGVRIPVDLDGKPTSHLLLWITSTSIDVEDTDRTRARMSEVVVYGAPVK